jgi:hypothetical protein
VTAVVPVFKDVCNQLVEPDGLIFDTDSVVGQAIKEDADYAGVRVTFLATLQNSRIAMQIDIGFGDVLTPAAVATEYPTILDLPAPRLNGYSRETVVAEKFEAMVKRGLTNSRMKDFYDIWLLSQKFDFDGSVPSNAITRTFAHRKTQILTATTALTRRPLPTTRKSKLSGERFCERPGSPTRQPRCPM